MQIPALLKTEAQSFGQSFYVSIKLSSGIPPMTGIFVPAGYSYGPSAIMVLYLHGWKENGQRNEPIDKLWNAAIDARMALREAVRASNKNVVFVAPTLGNNSEAGDLTEEGGLDRFVAGVQLSLKAYCGFPRDVDAPVVQCRVIACHSGGGIRMRTITHSGGDALADLAECWGFDSTYNRGDADWWAQWTTAKPHHKCFFYYIANSRTEAQAVLLRDRGFANAVVTESTQHDHMKVPIRYLPDRLRGDTALANSELLVV